jgi:hypothetical protein
MPITCVADDPTVGQNIHRCLDVCGGLNFLGSGEKQSARQVGRARLPFFEDGPQRLRVLEDSCFLKLLEKTRLLQRVRP